MQDGSLGRGSAHEETGTGGESSGAGAQETEEKWGWVFRGIALGGKGKG